LWEMYGMSERTFYDLVERAKDGSTAEDLKDRPSKPKNPYRKLTDEDKVEIINLRLDDIKRIESSKLAFLTAMEKTDHVLKPETQYIRINNFSLVIRNMFCKAKSWLGYI